MICIMVVQDFHKKYYVPHNLCLIACGKFTGGTQSLLSTIIRDIEPVLVEHGYKKGHCPPGWTRPLVHLESNTRDFRSYDITVTTPSERWARGLVQMTIAGPPIENYIHLEVSL